MGDCGRRLHDLRQKAEVRLYASGDWCPLFCGTFRPEPLRSRVAGYGTGLAHQTSDVSRIWFHRSGGGRVGGVGRRRRFSGRSPESHQRNGSVFPRGVGFCRGVTGVAAHAARRSVAGHRAGSSDRTGTSEEYAGICGCRGKDTSAKARGDADRSNARIQTGPARSVTAGAGTSDRGAAPIRGRGQRSRTSAASDYPGC